MEKILETLVSRIEGGMTKIHVPSEGKEIAFAYPSVGPGTYLNVGREILSRGRRVPTGEQMASLVHAAYCIPELENEPEFEDIRRIMKNNWLWIFNKNLWTPVGVYVLHDLKALGRNHPLNRRDLEKSLKGGKEINGIRFSKDGLVRFAPKGSYQLGQHTQESLAKDGFMIASYGKEGAEKLAEVSAKFTNKPYIHGVGTAIEEQRISALGEPRYLDGGRLDVFGYGFSASRDCRAFGVLNFS